MKTAMNLELPGFLGIRSRVAEDYDLWNDTASLSSRNLQFPGNIVSSLIVKCQIVVDNMLPGNCRILLSTEATSCPRKTEAPET